MKFTDVNPFSKNEQSKINKSLLSTVKKGDFILGKNVEKFEKKFSKLASLRSKKLLPTTKNTTISFTFGDWALPYLKLLKKIGIAK